jgi:hypothetical protein
MGRSESCRDNVMTGCDRDDNEVEELQSRCVDRADNGETSNFFTRCNARA